MVKHYFSPGCEINSHKPLKSPGHRKTSYLLSQQVQELFAIQAVYTWRLACCRPPQTKKKDILFKQKYCCPKLMITVLPGLSHSTVPEKYSNLHTTVCFQTLFPSAQSPLLVKIAEASAFGSNYISFSPSSATGHEVFLPQLQMRPFVFLYFFGVIW